MSRNIASFGSIMELLRCPRSGSRLKLDAQASKLISVDDATVSYRITRDIPVLIDFSKSIIPETKALESILARPKNFEWLKKLANGGSPVTERNCTAFIAQLKKKVRSPTVIVVGGGTIGAGVEALYRDESLRLITFDVYSSPNLSLVADAHSIPVCDSGVDGVWIQAVLEHVVEPHCVVNEIWRVLKDDGIVYAETPFMQMIHEGAYDYSRYSELGHRLLFRRFAALDSGVVAGPATVLRWAIRYFFAGLFRSRRIGTIAWALTFWLRFFDSAIPVSYATDGASCVYFLGQKSRKLLHPNELASSYRGAQ